MAKSKDSLLYRPHDVFYYKEQKSRNMIRKLGHAGPIIYDYLLDAIARNNHGYYLVVDDEFIEDMATDILVTENAIYNAIHFFINRAMFDEHLFNKDKVLTSEDVQSEYQELIKNRIQKRGKPLEVDSKIWLLSGRETESFIKVTDFSKISWKNTDNSLKNSDNSLKNTIKENKQKENTSHYIIQNENEETIATIDKNDDEESIEFMKSLYEKHNIKYKVE